MLADRSTRPPVWLVLGVFAAAWIARMVPAVFLPTVHHLDEVFQSLEQAHRITFGYGFVPWEFEHAIRSWILPGFVAGIMQLSLFIGEGPHIYLPLVAGVFAAIGAVAVVCAFLWASQLFGSRLGLVAVAIPAFAPELVYFSGKALTEVVGGHLLIIAAWLAFPGRQTESRGRALLAGTLAALAVAVRLQLGPAAAVIGVLALWYWPFGRVLWLVAGGLAVVAAAGTLDWATWGSPFLSYWNNFSYNILYGVASYFGVKPWYEYPGLLMVVWGGALGPLLALAAVGARRNLVLTCIVVVVFLSHAPIGHKELRFLYPLLLSVEILAGIGLAASLRWLGEQGLPERLLGAGWTPRARGLLGLGLLGLTLAGRFPSFMVIPGSGSAWLERRDDVRASLAISRMSNVCGIGAYGLRWGDTGYVYMHQRAPFYEANGAEQYAARLGAFNTIVFDQAFRHQTGLSDYTCYGRRCVGQRPGTCQPQAVVPMDLPTPLVGVPKVRDLWPPPAATWRQPGQ